MKRLAILLLLFIYLPAAKIQAQSTDEFVGENCTSIMVGRNASTDGSVITSHTCDGRYRTWATIEPAQKFDRDTTTTIYKGLLKTETPWDMRDVTIAGKIPQAKATFAFLNTAYPCLNEKQLAIGETTISGEDTLVNKNGMFLIEELERMALQRCSTARDAIKLIGKLIKDYGYGDSGECITIADKNEVWHMEIYGEGPSKIGGVWAAQRIPDDHVGISANISRISKIDLKDKEHFMASDNVFDVAKKLKLWDGKGPFKFWKAYGNCKKPYMIREFFVLNCLAPSLNLNMEMEELPFSVKPEKKVSVHDVIAFYRETYEGTPYDMTKNMKVVKKKYNDKREVISQDTVISPVANPWLSTSTRNLYNALQPNSVTYWRTVAVAWCSYSHIIQLRNWLPDEIGGLAWFSVDNPAQSPRIPIYCGTTKLPEAFNYCGQKRYRDDAIIWKYRKANKLATVAWQDTKPAFMKEVNFFEDRVTNETAILEQKVADLIKSGKTDEAKEIISRYTQSVTNETISRWAELEANYWHQFGMGF